MDILNSINYSFKCDSLNNIFTSVWVNLIARCMTRNCILSYYFVENILYNNRRTWTRHTPAQIGNRLLPLLACLIWLKNSLNTITNTEMSGSSTLAYSSDIFVSCLLASLSFQTCTISYYFQNALDDESQTHFWIRFLSERIARKFAIDNNTNRRNLLFGTQSDSTRSGSAFF